MKKDITYNKFQTLIKDKDKAVNFLIESTLQKTLSMFVYMNLPPTIPPKNLEHILQTNGTGFITEVSGNLYALSGTLGGEIDVYGFPKNYTVANVALKLSKCYDIENDGVLIKNDFYGYGLIPSIGKHAVLLTDSQISLNTAAILTRITMLISASDDKTKQSADLFIEKILNGDLSVIAENAFLKGVNLQTIPSTQNTTIKNLIELNQYYKSNLLAEIGLNSNWNAKRERLNETEILLNTDEILPFIENMLYERKSAIEKINEKYGTEITVELNTAWRTNKENNDKAAETLNTETDAEAAETIVTNETTQTETEAASDTEKIVNMIREMRDDETKDNKDNDEV